MNKNTKSELLFTILGLATLIIIGLAIIPEKPERFEHNYRNEKVEPESEKVYTIPCDEATSCKG